MPETNSESRAISENTTNKGWLEKYAEKIIGTQENMQPVIRACFSIVGFIAGFVSGYFVFAREKERKIQEQQLTIRELKMEIKTKVKELEESKSSAMRLETEKKLLNERKKDDTLNKGFDGLLTVKSIGHSYLD